MSRLFPSTLVVLEAWTKLQWWKVEVLFDVAGLSRRENKEAARDKYTRPQAEPGPHPGEVTQWNGLA